MTVNAHSTPQPIELTVAQAHQRALDLHRSGQLRDAERLYRAILQNHPNHPDANHNLGLLAVQARQPLAGLPYLKTALEANPNQGQYWFSYIDALIQANQTNAARQVLVQGQQRGLEGSALEALARKLGQSDTTGSDKQAEIESVIVHREHGRYKEAVQQLRTWLSSNPKDANGFALLAQVLSLDKQDGPAWEALNTALSFGPDLPVVKRNHARLLLRQQKLVEALSAAQAAYQGDPKDPENQLVLAAAFIASNQSEQACPLVESVLKIRPGYAEAYANRALLKLRDKDFSGALADAEKALSLKSHLPQVWHMVGSLRYQFKDLPGAIDALERLLVYEPENVNCMINLGEFRRQSGSIGAAIALLEKATKISPNNAGVWINLGAAYQESMRLPEAKAAYAKALEISPEHAEVANNLGALARDTEDWENALLNFEHALAYQPNRVAILVNKAMALSGLERHEEAERVARQAIELDPTCTEAYLTLSGALTGQRNCGEAQKVLEAIHTVVSTDVERASRLALAYADLYRAGEQWTEAEAWVRRALEVKPKNSKGLNALATCLLARDNPIAGLEAIAQSLAMEESATAKSLFVECVKSLQFRSADNTVREILVRAVSEPWGRPSQLASACIALLKSEPGIGECIARAADAWPARLSSRELFGGNTSILVAADPLLNALLLSVPNTDLEMERFLTMARCSLLETATAMAVSQSDVSSVSGFYSALARQCFINEYVFSYTDDEIQKASELRDSIVASLEANAQIPILWPVAVAAYFPLNSLPFVDRLLDMQWSEEIMAVLRQQITEPKEELQLRATIPRLTAIEDEVSLLVQSQYEENPYPRWVKPAPGKKQESIDIVLRKKFPLAGYVQFGKRDSLDILIAGCGTGQHSIGTAQRFRRSQVLAVDLSMASLSYAKRKTQELGLTSIEYAQADLLQLGSLGRSFDIVESVGVLHHLADPLAGWRVLLSLLRPRGVMRLGLYSELARRDIVRVRNLVAGEGYGSTAYEIRRCRQNLVELDESQDFGPTCKSLDFFSVSTCRDLLFHVWEHRMTLTEISAFLRDNNLAFLGFEIDPKIMRAYRLRFPDDRAATNLEQWQIFENEYPDTFFNMYQFWVQKAG